MVSVVSVGGSSWLAQGRDLELELGLSGEWRSRAERSGRNRENQGGADPCVEVSGRHIRFHPGSWEQKSDMIQRPFDKGSGVYSVVQAGGRDAAGAKAQTGCWMSLGCLVMTAGTKA